MGSSFNFVGVHINLRRFMWGVVLHQLKPGRADGILAIIEPVLAAAKQVVP